MGSQPTIPGEWFSFRVPHSATRVSRSKSGMRGTTAIIKFKPVVLTVGTVVGLPAHSHHDPTRADGHSAPGYTVKVRWFDPVQGRPVILSPYIPPMSSPESVVSRFALGSAVFFLFYAYERRPMYLRGLGSALHPKDAKRLHLELSVRKKMEFTLEHFVHARTWQAGEWVTWFPLKVEWDPFDFCRNAYLYNRRIKPSILIHIDDFPGRVGRAIYKPTSLSFSLPTN